MNVGTSKEGCCPILSSDTCGADPLVSHCCLHSAKQRRKGADTEQSLKVPVTCFSSKEGSYECPHGAECSPDGGCAGGSSTDKSSSARVSLAASNLFKRRNEVFGSDKCGVDGNECDG